jgi:hypothetical protein
MNFWDKNGALSEEEKNVSRHKSGTVTTEQSMCPTVKT